MKLKYKVVLVLFISSLILGFGGYAADLAYVALVGVVLFILSLTTLICSDKNDKSVLSILADGLLFNLTF